ncbi:MAG: hypothetical protein O7A08_01265 [SAR324 cluster bacterium]|nr:hypothetical protein [SAR324 cluster bacterium]MCZ6728458.1 hypothetical protein [SAR324 cluster bacterium]
MAHAAAASPPSLHRARVFWEQSQQDLKTAKRQQRAGAFLDGRYFSLQAALNALSAVCHLQGHFQLPNASVLMLLALCRDVDPRFALLNQACTALEEAALQNPFVPGTDQGNGKAAGRDNLAHSEAVIKAVRGYLKDNRKRYFAP